MTPRSGRFRWATFELVSATIFVLVSASSGVAAEAESPSSTPPPTVRYKGGKELDFEELLIQGQLRRPELSVVTGNTNKGGDGLLRLRENFLDRLAADSGEEVP